MEPTTNTPADDAISASDTSRKGKPQRIAWLVLSFAFVTFIAFCGVTGAAAYFYRTTATEARSVSLELIGGDSVFVRKAGYTDWRQASSDMSLEEGDSVRTGQSSRALITLFDSSTVLLSRNSEVSLDVLETSRYISREKRIRFSQVQGSSRVGVATLDDYSRSFFEVATVHATVTLNQPGGSYSIEVEPKADEPFTRVEARRGVAYVTGSAGGVTVGEEQKTIVKADGMPEAPSSAQRELLANGVFTKDLSHWREIREQGGDGGEVDGQVSLTTVDFNGKRTKAVELRRIGGNFDYASSGIYQEVNADVVDFVNLRLTLDAKIIYQSLSGGGSQSSEYPLMVRIRYLDSSGSIAEWYRGFYYQNEDGNPTSDGQLVQQNVWQKLTMDLRSMYPTAVYINSIDVFASGHDYDTIVANISLSGD